MSEILSSFVSIFTVLSIMFSGIPMIHPIISIWQDVFDFMNIKNSFLKVIILLISSIITSWDTIFKVSFGDTDIYKSISNLFANIRDV